MPTPPRKRPAGAPREPANEPAPDQQPAPESANEPEPEGPPGTEPETHAETQPETQAEDQPVSSPEDQPVSPAEPGAKDDPAQDGPVDDSAVADAPIADTPAVDSPALDSPVDDAVGAAPALADTADLSEVEIEALRLRVQELEQKLEAEGPADGAAPAPRRVRAGWWRPTIAALLVVIAALCAPAAVVARWARDEVSDTDRYVSTVAPLASDPAIQSAIINRITTEIFTRVDVQAVTNQAADALAAQGLPVVSTTLRALAAPIESSLQSFVKTQVTKIVESPAFANAWVAANRTAHEQLVAVLTGKDTENVTITDDAVKVNLGPIIATVKQQLVAQGFSLASQIPTVNASFTIFQSADITKAQRAFSALDKAATWLPILALVALAGAVFLVRDRLKMLMIGFLAVAASMLLLGAALNIFREVYLNALPASTSASAAGVLYDTLTHSMRLSLRAVLVVSLAVAIGAWLSGRSSGAAATRRGITRAAAAIRGGTEHVGLNTGPVGAFFFQYKNALRGVAIGVAVLTYVLASHPTGSWTLTVLLVLLVVLAVIELIARPPAPTSNESISLGPEAARQV